MFNFPLERLVAFAATARIIGLALAAIAGIVSLASTWLQTDWQAQLSARKDEAARQREAALQERIATAQVEAARAAEAAGKAHERAAGLERDAEQARVQHERLKEQVAWRTMSPETFSALANALKNGSGRVTLAYMIVDTEAMYFGYQISRALHLANTWLVQLEPRTYSDVLLLGLTITGRNPAAVRALRDAFKTSGLEFYSDDVPDPHLSIRPPEPPDALIMIGAKRPPF